MTERPEIPTETAIAAWVHLIRAAQGVLEQVEGDLKSAGYPPLSWYDGLLELRRAGRAGLRPFQLQEKMLLAQYSLSRLIDRLVQAGYVARQPSPADGRGQVLRTTPRGRKLLRSMWPVYRAAIRTHFAEKLGEREVADLGRILARLRA